MQQYIHLAILRRYIIDFFYNWLNYLNTMERLVSMFRREDKTDAQGRFADLC